MPFYQKLGVLPPKRHTQFRQNNGELHHEQLFGTIGFVGMSSLLYHRQRPTQVVEVLGSEDVRPVAAVERNLLSRKLEGWAVKPGQGWLSSRVPTLFNQDCTVALVAPPKVAQDDIYKNADQDEVVFVHRGHGILETMFGVIEFREGDYLVIPRGVMHRFKWSTEDNRALVVESASPVLTPKRYRNHFGQLLEHSPYCERDMRPPSALCDVSNEGEGPFKVRIKKEGMLHDYMYASHPFDVVGWDGYHFPYALSIHDFEPITGRVHQPPPVHQTFETDGFVICSFVPRLYDYHPLSIPAPYNHSNIDSDEVLYYVDGDFMSRTGVGPGQITLHPAGIPHGPHPGTYEGSIGKERTEELAVMVDTFRPLKVTQQALDLEIEGYHQSWL